MLASAPRVVRVLFSDHVKVAAGNAAVRNDGGTVLAGSAHVEGGRTLVLPLRRGLPDSDYTVRWSVVSDDGHRLQGVIAFAVGAGRAPPEPVLEVSGQVRVQDVVSRTLFLLGVLVAAGAQILLRRDGAGSALVVAAFSVAFLGSSSLLHESDAAGTRFALALEVATTAALGGAAAVAASRTYPGARWAARGAALVLLPLPTLSGHALDAGRPRALPVALDLVHVASAAVWLGGLAALALAVERDRAAAAARRFSPLALWSVGAIAGTGAARAWIELDAPRQLWTTGYGRAILVKTALFAVLLVLGWINRARLLAAADRAGGALARLRLNVRAETALVVGVVAAVGVLTALRPAGQAAVAAPAPTGATPPPQTGALHLARQDRDLAVALAARRVGERIELTATVLGPDGKAATLSGVGVSWVPEPSPATQLNETQFVLATADPCGPGCWRARVPARPLTNAGLVSVTPSGYPVVAFRLPRTFRPAGVLLRRAELAFRRLRTVTVDETLSSGPGRMQRSRQRMAAPDRFSFELPDGTAGVVVGSRRWDRVGRGPWVVSVQAPPLRLPTPLWSRASRDARLIGPNRITFVDPSLPAWFDVELDRRSGLPTRVRMVAAAHFMTDRYSGFDRPVEISPPG